MSRMGFVATAHVGTYFFFQDPRTHDPQNVEGFAWKLMDLGAPNLGVEMTHLGFFLNLLLPLYRR